MSRSHASVLALITNSVAKSLANLSNSSSCAPNLPQDFDDNSDCSHITQWHAPKPNQHLCEPNSHKRSLLRLQHGLLPSMTWILWVLSICRCQQCIHYHCPFGGALGTVQGPCPDPAGHCTLCCAELCSVWSSKEVPILWKQAATSPRQPGRWRCHWNHCC